jgi:hypothetical protein|nr:MAG TPA: hypothetical protein [Ackermannviridae sp.]
MRVFFIYVYLLFTFLKEQNSIQFINKIISYYDK